MLASVLENKVSAMLICSEYCHTAVKFREVKFLKSENKAEIEHGQKCRNAAENSLDRETPLCSLRKATFSFDFKIRFFLITKAAIEQLHLNIKITLGI